MSKVAHQRPGRTLLVAAAGGHLAELVELRHRITGLEPRPLWMAPKGEQTSELLADEDVVAAPSVRPRDVRNLLAASVVANRLLTRERICRVVSTGSGVALAAFLPARARAIPCHYIESAARVDGPSLTGRLVQRLPGVQLYTQHTWPGRGGWQSCSSVFDGFEGRPRERSPGSLRVVVTVGTMSFGFRRLLERLVDVLPPSAEVVWQTGCTDVNHLAIVHRAWMSAHELQTDMRNADVVITHAGVGSALAALQAGALPVLVPRRAEHGEHVDDHQVQIARALEDRGLARCVEPTQITRALLDEVSGWSVHRRPAGTAGIMLTESGN